MPLYLSGGGVGKKSEDIDKLFSEGVDKSKPVLYIPIAINIRKHPYSECLTWIKDTFKPYGLENFVMWTEKELYTTKNSDLSDFGGVYIGGGNTFYLSQQLRDAGFWNLLTDAAQHDAHIYGGSAGAAIFGKTIIPAFSVDKNEEGLTDLTGINKIDDYHFWAHYDILKMQTVLNFSKTYGLDKIIGVPEETALYIHNEDIHIIGKKPVIIFNNCKTYECMPKSIIPNLGRRIK